VIGEMDDVAVVLSGLWLFVRLCPPEVVREVVQDIAARAKVRGRPQTCAVRFANWEYQTVSGMLASSRDLDPA